jgi:hypothetical protein
MTECPDCKSRYVGEDPRCLICGRPHYYGPVFVAVVKAPSGRYEATHAYHDAKAVAGDPKTSYEALKRAIEEELHGPQTDGDGEL